MSKPGTEKLLDKVAEYYSGKLLEHGATSKGVDWKDDASQDLRFEQLIYTMQIESQASILDYGCGFGSFLPILRKSGFKGEYTGFDISNEMIEAARELHGSEVAVWVSEVPSAASFEYVVASGILNVKLDHSDEEWKAYVTGVLNDMDRLSEKGFVFNALTNYSDKEYRRRDLYYADPLELFDFCKRNYSSFVTLNHGYPLYEFTLAVFKKGAA